MYQKIKKEILLSICIPTYNRSKIIKEKLNLLISEEVFQNNNDIEIVISDNCSIDDTEKVCLHYVNLYPEKIRYYRNDKNIRDENFELVLGYGNGKYLKIQKDKKKRW
ncbi:glycosyltransferase family 2 protein [bacterium]|nr:glycosyltransferase family 2 protein [bacterium]